MLPSERSLKDYLPDFLISYFKRQLDAEEPEFELAWNNIADFLDNAFLFSVHETGIARFEKLLKITPTPEDTFESRLLKIFARWNNVSYTWKLFLEKIQILCGEDYELTENWNEYQLYITTHLDLYGQVEELEHIFGYMLPANIQVIAENILNYLVEGNVYVAAGHIFIDMFQLTDSFNITWSLNNVAYSAANGSGTCEIMLTDSFNDIFASDTEVGTFTAYSIANQIEVSDSFQDTTI